MMKLLAGAWCLFCFILMPCAIAQDKAAPPMIDGVWQEGPEENRIRVTITQKDEKFEAVCVYKHAEHGEIRWEMKGTISKDGEIRGPLVHTKAPEGWVNQVRVGVVSADGKTITGRANLQGAPPQDFVWRLVPKKK
jgi:hypothetical protein